MRGGVTFSALLHLAVLVVIVVGLPDFGRDLEISPAIPVEIATLDDITRPKPVEKPQPKVEQPEEPQEIPEAPKPPPQEAAPAPPPPPEPVQQAARVAEPAPPEPEPEPEPLPLPPEPKVEPEPEPEPEEVKKTEPEPEAPRPVRKPPPKKKAKKKPEKKKEKPKPDTLASVLKNVLKLKEDKPAPVNRTQEAAEPQQTSSLSSEPVSEGEKDRIRRHIEGCWNIPAGARDAENLVVGLRLNVNPDGTVQQVEVVDRARMLRDSFYRTAAESAARAVRLCEPLPVPTKNYNTWRVMVLNFNPQEMLGQ